MIHSKRRIKIVTISASFLETEYELPVTVSLDKNRKQKGTKIAV